jgi:predicted  nucleic acid-binding Zn-ribbon protein
MENDVGKKVVCSKCGHVWLTRSESIFVTCPSCQLKVRIIKQIDE